MKKVKPVHPKLYLKIINSDNPLIVYKQNQFDNDSKRMLLKESLNEYIKIDDSMAFLIKNNQEQQIILKKYIKNQKKVLEKHEKAGNYDASKVVKNSIDLLFEFNEEFNQWFNNIDYDK